MPVLERKQTVMKILGQLRGFDALRELFWTELNYERENQPLSMCGWPDFARSALADDPILFAGGGGDQAFHVLYCRLASDSLQKNLERPIVNQLVREHPYCLFVTSDKEQSIWRVRNIKYDDKAEMRWDSILPIRKPTQQQTADTTALERELDRLVYELYGLTKEKIAGGGES